MVVYTWWCWHICKGEEIEEEKELNKMDRTTVVVGPDSMKQSVRTMCCGSGCLPSVASAPNPGCLARPDAVEQVRLSRIAA
jgi:hypothetical protein